MEESKKLEEGLAGDKISDFASSPTDTWNSSEGTTQHDADNESACNQEGSWAMTIANSVTSAHDNSSRPNIRTGEVQTLGPIVPYQAYRLSEQTTKA